MLALSIVEVEICGQSSACLVNSPVRSEKDVLIFYGAPQSFGKDVVHASAFPVHADPDISFQKNVGVFYACKLHALIAVMDIGNRNGNGPGQRINAEGRVE